MPHFQLNLWRFLAQFIVSLIVVACLKKDIRVSRDHTSCLVIVCLAYTVEICDNLCCLSLSSTWNTSLILWNILVLTTAIICDTEKTMPQATFTSGRGLRSSGHSACHPA